MFNGDGVGWSNPPSVTLYDSDNNLGALMYVMGVIHGSTTCR